MKPIKFNSWEEMYNAVVMDDIDLYSPEARMYVFHYNAYGSLAYYDVDENEAKELAEQAMDENYWGAYLGVGGYILDIGDDYEKLWEQNRHYEERDDNSACWFCKDYYNCTWYDTKDYTEEVTKL